MVKRHLKAIAVPKTWDINRKENTFITRPLPGAHPLNESYSLGTVLKNLLNIAQNASEVKFILTNREVFVDGERRKSRKHAVGLMDVVSIPALGRHFRLLINRRGKIFVHEIKQDESKFKLCKIRDKHVVGGGKIQIETQDGRAIIVDPSDQKSYRTGDSLFIEVPGQKILQHIPLEKGVVIFLTRGSHVGLTGIVQDVKKDSILFKTPDGEIFETSRTYAFVVGKDKQLISLPAVLKTKEPEKKAERAEKSKSLSVTSGASGSKSRSGISDRSGTSDETDGAQKKGKASESKPAKPAGETSSGETVSGAKTPESVGSRHQPGKAAHKNKNQETQKK